MGILLEWHMVLEFTTHQINDNYDMFERVQKEANQMNVWGSGANPPDKLCE